MRFAWIDVRTVPGPQLQAVLDAAIHSRIDGVLAADVAVLRSLPPTVTRVLFTRGPDVAASPKSAAGAEDQPDRGTRDGPQGAGGPDVLLRTITSHEGLGDLVNDNHTDGTVPAAGYVDVRDDGTLRLACAAADVLPYTIIHFADPTKIPLEIVLAAAERCAGKLVTVVSGLEEAAIVFDVLERGSDAIVYAPADAGEVFALARLLDTTTPQLSLSTLTVDGIEHVGLGDRVCVDTCSHFGEDEGILVGSYASGFILCCSETHPLPYMPTRPFRVNAGALHSYVLALDNRTNYLSELRSGSTVLAVGADGRTRRVVVGRAKLESRPLLAINAHAGNGQPVSLTVQDDWHVRVLGPGGKVLNVTELQVGDELLGYLATDKRHVGLPIGEFCRET